MRATLLVFLAGCLAITGCNKTPVDGAAALPRSEVASKTSQFQYSAEQEEEANRRIRFGDREVFLESRLRVYKIRLENAQLQSDIARQTGEPENTADMKIASLYVAEARKAIEVSKLLAKVWYRTGNEPLQKIFEKFEREAFDKSSEQCLQLKETDTYLPALQEAEEACAELDHMYSTVTQHKFKGTEVSTFFTQSSASTALYAEWLRDDIANLERDNAIAVPSGNTVAIADMASTKMQLILTDNNVIDLDKLLWNQVLRDEMCTKHNRAHPYHQVADTTELSSKSVPAQINLRDRLIQYGDSKRQYLKIALR